MAQAQIIDVDIDDMASALNDHYKRCSECRGSDTLCRSGQREFEAFWRTYQGERRSQLAAHQALARATACAPYARRNVVTVRVS